MHKWNFGNTGLVHASAWERPREARLCWWAVCANCDGGQRRRLECKEEPGYGFTCRKVEISCLRFCREPRQVIEEVKNFCFLSISNWMVSHYLKVIKQSYEKWIWWWKGWRRGLEQSQLNWAITLPQPENSFPCVICGALWEEHNA